MPIQLHLVAFLIKLLSILLAFLLGLGTNAGELFPGWLPPLCAASPSENRGASQPVYTDRISMGRISNAFSETLKEYLPHDLVWVSEKGKRYHTVSTCSGMKNPTLITQEEAEKNGRTPCKDCAYWLVVPGPEDGHP